MSSTAPEHPITDHTRAGAVTWQLSADMRHGYVDYLTRRCADPGTRAALRRGLRRLPDESPLSHPIVAPWLPANPGSTLEAAMYAVASYAALQHPQPTLADANLGATLAPLRTSMPTVEDRLNLLMRQPIDGVLYRHLPGLLSTLHTQNRPGPDLALLLDDLTQWTVRRDRIVRRWAQAFYRITGNDPAHTEPAGSSPAAGA